MCLISLGVIPSGGGKSTIANLLARFWDVKEGSIKERGTHDELMSIGGQYSHMVELTA